ncbi:MAG: hypothetical protein ACJ75B_22460 [Flavisolibacter sp.]
MKLRLLLLVPFVFTLSSCLVGDTKCCDHVSTDTISKGLYIERYRTFCAGVFGDLTECYITDSTTFRQNIGSYDEHEFFRVTLNGDKIEAYNLLSDLTSDTIDKKTITKTDLLKYQHTEKNLLSTSPVFGKNTIKCDDDFYPASSYKTDDGYDMKQVQYKCGSDYLNAVFYTDHSKFSVFIGVYIPGSFENNYSVRQHGSNFDFYNVTERRKTDTVKVQTYLLSDLKKGKLINVCSNGDKQK